MFGMDDVMQEMYSPQRGGSSTTSNKRTATKTREDADVSRSPSMAGLMNLVGEMYQPGGDDQQQNVSGNNVSSASNDQGTRRTREGGNATSGGCGSDLKGAFCEFVKKLDQAVTSADSSNKEQGDQLWREVVDHVDQCWKAFTEQGQVPQ